MSGKDLTSVNADSFRSTERGRAAPKVVHVIDNLEPGGAQHILIALTQGDPEAAVCVLHAKEEETELHRQFRSVDVVAQRKSALAKILFGLARRILRHRSRAFVNAHLEASTVFLCLLRRLIDFRLVVTVHATQRQWPRWFRAVFRRIIFIADHVIVESHGSYDETRALGITDERLTLIPIGTMRSARECNEVTADIRLELGIPPGIPIFLNIARMVAGKGQIHLVHAMAKVPDAVAVIVGYGPEAENLRAEATRLGVQERVRFTGRRTDLNNFYAAARAFVMPCLDESMGVVIYDALTFQLPVVAYASGSIGEIVTDGENGFLLPRDPDALATALLRVLGNETSFKFQPPEAYSAATMVERHKTLYGLLAGKWFGAAAGKHHA